MCWGSGPITAIKKIQKCLNLRVDGVVGTDTLNALNSPNSEVVFNKLWEMRRIWLINIATIGNNHIFLKGWLNRLNDYKFSE
jgi:lysozyme family protein